MQNATTKPTENQKSMASYTAPTKRIVRFDLNEPTVPAKSIKTPFWGENPNVLFQSDSILVFYPSDDLSYNAKLNAITRSVLVLTLIGLLFTRHVGRLLFLSLLTLACIWGIYEYHVKNYTENMDIRMLDPIMANYMETHPQENASGEPVMLVEPNPINNIQEPTVFQQPTSENPFSNVLMSDFDYNPHKLPAPPISNPNVNNMVTEHALKLIQEANPGQPNISDKLLKNMDDQLSFEQSMRPFFSNPATTIPNDQGAFAEFCYGSMISCKEGNLFACARNTSHYTNY